LILIEHVQNIKGFLEESLALFKQAFGILLENVPNQGEKGNQNPGQYHQVTETREVYTGKRAVHEFFAHQPNQCDSVNDKESDQYPQQSMHAHESMAEVYYYFLYTMHYHRAHLNHLYSLNKWQSMPK